MKLVLDIATSAEFWRRFYPANRHPKPPSISLPPGNIYTGNKPLDMMPPWVSGELLDELGGIFYLLTFDPNQRRHSSSRIIRAWTGPLPESSFHQLSEAVFVMSPACMFLQAASILDMVQLIAFGDELCGLYSFDARTQRSFRKRTAPLTNKETVKAYLAGANGCYGRKKAAAALRYVVERSASPMETFDEMAICLPYRLGGYGIREFEMNMRIPLTPKASRIAKQQKCYADMCLPDIKLDVEHHGKLDHSNPDEMEHDRARVNALKEMGFEVIELTADQVGDLLAFEYIVQRIARLSGKRISADKLGATPERLKLRKSVFEWNQTQGSLLAGRKHAANRAKLTMRCN